VWPETYCHKNAGGIQIMIKQNEDEIVFIFDQNLLFQTCPGDIENMVNPEPGFGGRAFMCDRYERCLYYAACNEWPGFHCESCFYKKRGFISFYLKDFLDLNSEDEYQEIDFNKLRRASTTLH
jgi:hypothetical protein